MIPSLRLRILAVGLFVAGIPTMVAAVYSWQAVRRDIVLHHQQQTRAFAIAWRWQITDPQDHHSLRSVALDPMPPWHDDDRPTGWVVQHGQVLAAYGPLATLIPGQEFAEIPKYPSQATFQLTEAASKTGSRFVIAYAGLGDEEEFLDHATLIDEPLVIVARPITDRDRSIRQQTLAIAAWATVALCVGLLVLALAVSVALRPLHRLRQVITSYQPGISPADMPAAPAEHAPSELRPVWEALRDLSARLEAAISRERRLVSEIAHELRTPLAGLRARLEVDQPSPETQQACWRLACNMQQLVEKLLLLTRLESGMVAITMESTPLEDLLDEVSERLNCSQHRPWTVVGDGQIMVDGDYELLSIALGNLLDNARRHGRDPGATTIAIERQAGAASIRITNPIHAPIDTEVLQRLSRGQPSELPDASTATDRHGIGLALTARIIAIHGGALELHCTQTPAFWAFTAMLHLPHHRTQGQSTRNTQTRDT